MIEQIRKQEGKNSLIGHWRWLLAGFMKTDAKRIVAVPWDSIIPQYDHTLIRIPGGAQSSSIGLLTIYLGTSEIVLAPTARVNQPRTRKERTELAESSPRKSTELTGNRRSRGTAHSGKEVQQFGL